MDYGFIERKEDLRELQKQTDEELDHLCKRKCIFYNFLY